MQIYYYIEIYWRVEWSVLRVFGRMGAISNDVRCLCLSELCRALVRAHAQQVGLRRQETHLFPVPSSSLDNVLQELLY